MQHLVNTSLWIFAILSGFCFKAETLHFRNGEPTFCICIHSVRYSYHGYLPSLPYATNADVDMSAVYAEKKSEKNGRC